jgi:D5 N terminal like/Poxvirus D5 protein-like
MNLNMTTSAVNQVKDSPMVSVLENADKRSESHTDLDESRDDTIAPYTAALNQCHKLKHGTGDRVYVQGLVPKKLKSDLQAAEKLGLTYENGANLCLKVVSGYLLLSETNAVFFEQHGKSKIVKYPDGFGRLAELNNQGFGIYFRPNPGGDNAANITEARSLFYEIDGVSKDEQWERLRKLESKLGKKASLVIETKESLHCYFLLDEPYSDLKPWKQDQQRLIQHQDSDRAICNPERLMRMADFNHVDWNAESQALELVPVQIVQDEPTVFSRAEFDAILPEWKPEKPKKSATEKKPKTAAVQPVQPSQERYANYIDFLERSLKPAYLRLSVQDQFNHAAGRDLQLTEVSPGQLAGFNPLGDTFTNPAAFSVKVEDDGMPLWRSFSTDQSGNIFEFLTLQLYGSPSVEGSKFFDFLRFLCDKTGLSIPEYLDEKNQERKLRELLGDEAADLAIKYPLFTEKGVKLTIEQVVMNALFSSPWLRSEANLCRFNGEYYEWVEDVAVAADIAKFLHKYPALTVRKNVEQWGFDYAGEGFVKRCLAWVKMRVPKLQESKHLICFKNYVLNTLTGEQMKHSPDRHITSQIQSDYYRGAECPEVFSDFIRRVYGSEYLEVWRAIISMFLDPGCMYGKAIHVVGQSGGGKGTTLRFLASLFDPGSVQSLGSFSDLATPEKRHQNLRGKNFAYLPDLGGFQQMLQAFYEMVDNGALSGRALYESEAYTKAWHCRFALASVSELKIENGGDGWMRRMITLRVKDRTGTPDRSLAKKLEAVRSEVISWALGMDRDRRAEVLENPELVAPAIGRDNHKSSIVGDAVKTFIDCCFTKAEGDDSRIASAELYQLYTAYYRASGTGKPMGLNNFVQHMKVIFPGSFHERTRIKGSDQKIPAGFIGLRQIEDIFTPSVDSSGEPGFICNLNKTIEGSYYTEFAEPEIEWCEAIDETDSPTDAAAVAVVDEYVGRLLLSQGDEQIKKTEASIVCWDIDGEPESTRQLVSRELNKRLEVNPSRKAIKAQIAATLSDVRRRKANGEAKPAIAPEYDQPNF